MTSAYANLTDRVNGDSANDSYSVIRGFFWILFFVAGIGAIIADLLIRYKYLAQASPIDYVRLAIVGVTLHLVGCYIAGGAVWLAPPKNKALLALSIVVLAANVLFTFLLIATGAFTLTHIRA
ncbi:MAG: hypothetical protein HKL95_03450 [Phycisphaerae bacterium]|nr:hypothetical protein [Phycisphaerae bacterium]